MLEILNALISELLAVPGLKDVFLTDDISPDGEADTLPRSLRLPAAAVKDDGEDPPEDGTAASQTRFFNVLVALYVPKSSRHKLGQALKDSLTLGESVKDRLDRNLLNLTACSLAQYNGAWGSVSLQLFGDGPQAQRIVLKFRYEMEE